MVTTRIKVATAGRPLIRPIIRKITVVAEEEAVVVVIKTEVKEVGMVEDKAGAEITIEVLTRQRHRFHLNWASRRRYR